MHNTQSEGSEGSEGEVQLDFERGLVTRSGPVHCPACATPAVPLTCRAKGRDAVLSCSKFHTWRHEQIEASAVRQMFHEFRQTGALTALPAIWYPSVDLVPVLAEPTTLAPAPPAPPVTPNELSAVLNHSSARPETLAQWEIAAAAQNGGSIFRPLLMHARRVARRVLPWDGPLYARLCLSGGGSAVDGHMAVVVVALAAYAAAQRTGSLRPSALGLDEVAAMLDPAVADTVVRRLRPRADASHYLLRAADVTRLDTAPDHDWARWRRAALDLVTAADDQYRQAHKDTVEHAVLGQLPHQTADDDLTWYAPARD
ncbi:hypothetical protein [Streptomyces diastaticus]